jgi:excisionase family DNA binding protein
MNLAQYITLPVNDFAHYTGIGRTMVYSMIADGQLRAVRIGPKKLLIDIDSYRELLAKLAAEGTPDFPGVQKAIAARRAKLARKDNAKADALKLAEELGI